jgi:microsomal epoxide hydrolase
MSWAAVIRVVASVLFGVIALQAFAESQEPLHTVCFDTSDQVRLCYVEHLSGDASAPILVFIPGWTMPASLWEKQLAYFSGKYPVVAFDPRGQGASATPDFGYTLERRVQDIKELLDRFPDRSFILVGWSLAVFESLAYVEQYGENRLKGLVLVDNSIGAGPETPARTGENPFFEELRTHRAETLRKFVAAIFRKDPGAEVQEKVLASALKTEVEDSIRLLSYQKPRTYWKETLYTVGLPILYLVTPKLSVQATELTRSHPQATAKIFEHSGHALFWDEADPFNRALHDFIERLGHAAMERQAPIFDATP